MNGINKALESRINKMMDLAFEIQTMPVAIVDSKEVIILRRLGTTLGEYIDENISPDDIASFDIDIEMIDEIFTVSNISGLNITNVNVNALADLQKDKIVNIIYTLDNLKKLLLNNIKDYVDEVKEDDADKNTSKEVMPVKSTQGGELLPKDGVVVNDAFNNDIMEQFMYQQVSNALGNNPMIQMVLLQKQQERKLNKSVLMKLLSMAPTGYLKGGMESVMVLNYLNQI